MSAMKRIGVANLIVCLILFPAALVPILGWTILAASGLLVLVLALLLLRPKSTRQRVDLPLRLAIGLAVLGGIVGAASVITAVASYDDAGARIGFAWFALGCAVAAAGTVFLAPRHPALAGIILVMGGLAGGIAINLFSINTAYGAAVPLWWLAALILFAGSCSSHPAPLR